MNDYTDIDPFHNHRNEYNHWLCVARAKGWVLPVDYAFPDHAWISYWQRMDRYERGEQRGRPVPPHRSG